MALVSFAIFCILSQNKILLTEDKVMNALEAAAARNLGLLLPLEKEALIEIINYASSLPGPDEAASYFYVCICICICFKKVVLILSMTY